MGLEKRPQAVYTRDSEGHAEPILSGNEKLIADRLKLISEQDPTLEIGPEFERGTSAVVFDCRKDGSGQVLKVSWMRDGIPRIEVDSLSFLAGVPGIPRLYAAYTEGSETFVGIRRQKIDGILFPAFAEEDSMASVLEKIYDIIEEFHKKGLLMPRDWRKEDNWLIDQTGQPYLIDTAESYRMDQNYSESSRQVMDDMLSWHQLAERYKDGMKKREWHRLDDIWYRHYLLHKPD